MSYLKFVELQRPKNRLIEERRKTKKLRSEMGREKFTAWRQAVMMANGAATASQRPATTIDLAAVKAGIYRGKPWYVRLWIRIKRFFGIK